MKLYKRKRPRGFWTTRARQLGDDEHGSWLHLPVGSPWSSADASGVLPFSVVVLLAPGRPWVAWWVDDVEDRRIEIDVCLPPERDEQGWSFVDLELDPVRHADGRVEVWDRDEFEVACRDGWIPPAEATVARDAAAHMEVALRDHVEPYGDEGWQRLAGARVEVHTCTTEALDADEVRAIRALLDDAFAGEFADEDWQNALGGAHAVVTDSGNVVAHAAVVPRVLEVGERPFRTGYVEAVAAEPRLQGEELGSLAMEAIAHVVRHEFELGALSTSRHGFYARLGWERWQGPTFVRDDQRVFRTAEEDDGVMVLRFGPSATADLAAPIVCEARPGDDW